jgi:hypothetical protein
MMNTMTPRNESARCDDHVGPQRAGRASVWLRSVGLALATFATGAQALAQPLPQGYATDDPKAQPPAPKASDAPKAQDKAPAPTPAVAQEEYVDTDPSALTDFRDTLDGHGTWVEDPNYGTVWMPSPTEVGADFAPYQTGGSWTLTDDGDWYWASTYSWGYVPFHYGRWVYTGRGWAWIPGRVYAPAWVIWRTGDYGYLGWAPAPPTYYWSGGVALTLWATPVVPWVFCPSSYVFYPHVHSYVLRDRAVIQRVAAYSTVYQPTKPAPHHVPAQPKPGTPQGVPKSGQKPPAPTPKEAKIPDTALPKSRAKPEARALGFSSRTATSRTKSEIAREKRSGYSVPSSEARSQPGLRTPGSQPPSPSRSAPSAPPSREGVTYPGMGRSAPPSQGRPGQPPSAQRSRQPTAPGAQPRAPGPSPRSTPAPRSSPQSSPRSAPAPRAPSVSQPSRSTPSASRSQPSRSGGSNNSRSSGSRGGRR